MGRRSEQKSIKWLAGGESVESRPYIHQAARIWRRHIPPSRDSSIHRPPSPTTTSCGFPLHRPRIWGVKIKCLCIISSSLQMCFLAGHLFGNSYTVASQWVSSLLLTLYLYFEGELFYLLRTCLLYNYGINIRIYFFISLGLSIYVLLERCFICSRSKK